MIATSIIERELRVRTRTRVTHWQRLLVASLAGLACAGTFTWSGQSSSGVAGQQLFRTLTALAFVFCLVEGIRVTCDCLSGERREGTIGLLFLTDLRPFEIVLGKLVAGSATAFCSLVAAAPALVVPLLFGGVTVGGFWRAQL